MKKITVITFALLLYSFISAQDMKGMKMPANGKDKKETAKKKSIRESILKSETKDTALIDMNKNMDVKIDSSKSIKSNDTNDMNINSPLQDSEARDQREQVNFAPGKTIRYDLYVTDTIVNFTGKTKHAYAINGSIPAPTLIFTEGDTAEIYLHNMLASEETSLHWHGIILPNQADGVPYLTTAPIRPGETHLYKFAIVQNGTYWYHSHSQLQEQAGMYGALVFKKREAYKTDAQTDTAIKNYLFNSEYTMVLSEWTDEKPYEVQRRLRTGNDWYAIKKGSTQSYAEAIRKGYFKTKLANEWKRMKSMDVSDVYYDRFLLNGKPESDAPEFKAGDRVKLRIINGGASSYFWVQYAGGKLTVVANDGNDVDPVEVDRLIIGVAETYDVIVTLPESMSYEFRATPEDRTKSTSLWLGSGMKMYAPVLPKLQYFEGMKMMNNMMKLNGDLKMMKGMEMSYQVMDMNGVMYPEITGNNTPENKRVNFKNDTDKMQGMNMTSVNTNIITLNYTMLRSPVKTTLPDAPYKELHFTLTGNMSRYEWSINDKTVNEWDRILIEKGQNVRIILFNNSMMRHPMHLHGHDFRVLNGQGEYAPLKNVVDIMPMERDTIEFAANQSGNWFFHCHILYHMMAGMGNVFTYVNSPVNPELPGAALAYRYFKKDNHMIHPMAELEIENNGVDGEAMLEGNRFSLQAMWHLGYADHHGYEGELNFGRYIGKMQWLFPYIGFDYHYKKADMEDKNIFGDEKYNLFGQLSNKNNRKTLVAGVQYTLPMLVIADVRIDGNGKLRFQLARENVPLSNRLRFNLMINTDKEYATGFKYIITKWLSASANYDSDMGIGAGIILMY